MSQKVRNKYVFPSVLLLMQSLIDRAIYGLQISVCCVFIFHRTNTQLRLEDQKEDGKKHPQFKSAKRSKVCKWCSVEKATTMVNRKRNKTANAVPFGKRNGNHIKHSICHSVEKVSTEIKERCFFERKGTVVTKRNSDKRNNIVFLKKEQQRSECCSFGKGTAEQAKPI